MIFYCTQRREGQGREVEKRWEKRVRLHEIRSQSVPHCSETFGKGTEQSKLRGCKRAPVCLCVRERERVQWVGLASTQDINYRVLELWRAKALPREHCVLIKILYNSCGLHVCFVHVHSRGIVCVCVCDPCWKLCLLESLFNQAKVEKGAPREHFSLQMKSDENRPLIASESFQSATFSRKHWLCVCHLSIHQTL